MTPRDPYDLIGIEKNIVSEMQKLRQKITSLYRQNVRVNSLSELAAFGGTMSDTTFGNSFLDGDGIHTSADLVDINWWLPLNLSTDVIFLISDIVFDGTEYIYVGGTFSRIGGVDATNIARYSLITRNWETVGGGVNNSVNALAINNSGVLYIAGSFTNAGGDANADYIAKLVAGSWVSVSSGAIGPLTAIAFDSADNLYIGGFFTNAGGDASADYIAKLVTGSWVNVGGGLNNNPLSIAFDGADNLYVGGLFTNAGGDASADYVAKLVAGSWVNVGSGVNAVVRRVAFDDVDNLYIGGAFTDAGGDTAADGIAKLVSGSWINVGGGVNGAVYDIVFDAQKNIYISGVFTGAGEDDNADRVAVLLNNRWVSLSNSGGLGSEPDSIVYKILPLSNGSVIAGGSFNYAGSIVCQNIALYCKPLSESIDLLASLFELYAATRPLWINNVLTATISDINAVGWTRYYFDLSGLTADRNLVLPVPSAVNEEIEINIAVGSSTYELIIKGTTGITINSGSTASEWSRLFITNETVKLVANSLTNWQVTYDGRIPCKAVFERITSNANTTHSAATDTKADWNSLPLDVGNMGDLTNDRAKIRRAGIYQCGGSYAPVTAISDLKYFNVLVYKNGTGGTRVQSVADRQSASGSSSIAGVGLSNKPVQCAVDDYLEYFFKTEESNRGLLATDYTGAGYEVLKGVVFFSVTEILG